MTLLNKLRNPKLIPVIGLLFTLGIIAVPVFLILPERAILKDNPWSEVPKRPPHTDHSSLLQGPFETGSDVTRACLECHPDAASQVMGTVHWTWQSPPAQLAGRSEPVSIGKKNTINNFCLGIQSNWPGCTSCHAGYGWMDADFDFNQAENVDCLICHEQTGAYVKGQGGLPVEGVDLLAASQSVATPTRENCGGCHFKGGGGNAVKHGDLDEHLYHPPESVDVHMGRHDFQCIDCHQTEDHVIRGRAISVSLEMDNQVYCTDCHMENLHEDERINAHLQTVACQTCHIPAGAVRDATKMEWDWSTAGQDLPEDPHTYLKIKGSFVYEADFIPEYYWYNGLENRYLFGDVIDPSQTTALNPVAGDITDPQAKIFPFKVHRARQPYDAVYNYLLQPKTVGEFWVNFDWDKALEEGSKATGLAYSGQYGFAETEMFWPITHMVTPSEDALQCTACHADNIRMDWRALGYFGDPIEWGGRFKVQP